MKLSIFTSVHQKHVEYNFHHINYYFSIALLLFIHTNLVYININIVISLFLNVAPSQNLVIAPGASDLINTVYE